jgi:predicted Zn-dependent protease
VAARVFTQHPLCPDPALNLYVSQVGLAVARKSSRPRVFRGYHFAVLETPEPVTVACPGGFILVSRGALKMCDTEDELAALLAHEVAHVGHRDGIKAIKQARWAELVAIARTKAAQQRGGEAGQIATIYEESVEDILKSLMVKGYSRQTEWQADHEALRTLALAGYNPGALASLLAKMTALEKRGRVIFKSHPPAAWRLEKVREQVGEAAPDPLERKRTERFKKQNL